MGYNLETGDEWDERGSDCGSRSDKEMEEDAE